MTNYIISDADVEEIKRLQKSGYDQTESITEILTAKKDESGIDVFHEIDFWIDQNAGYTDYSRQYLSINVEEFNEFMKDIAARLGIEE